MHTRRYPACQLVVAMSVVLLAISLAGRTSRATSSIVTAPTARRDGIAADVAQRATSMSKLAALASSELTSNRASSAADTAIALAELVGRRFVHGESRHHFLDNWLLATLGSISPAFGHIWDPDLLLARSDSLQCDQSSYVLLALARRFGFRTRHVGLGGHVVTELWYSGDWHIFDPDYNVFGRDSSGRVVSAEEIARDSSLIVRSYRSRGVEMPRFRREEFTFVAYPQGARWEWKANALAAFERAAEVMIWLIPLCGALSGAICLARRRSIT